MVWYDPRTWFPSQPSTPPPSYVDNPPSGSFSDQPSGTPSFSNQVPRTPDPSQGTIGVIKTSTPSRTGGGSGGGGGGGGGEGNQPTQTTKENPTPSATTGMTEASLKAQKVKSKSDIFNISERNNQSNQTENQKRQEANKDAQQNATEKFNRENIIVRPGKGVQSGSITSYGNAVVPGSGGKTANQIQDELFQQAREKFGSDTPYGSYTATIPIINTNSFNNPKKDVDSFTIPVINTNPFGNRKFFVLDSKSQRQEAYNPQSDSFVSTSPTGRQGTAYSRPPTVEEKQKLDAISNPVARAIFGDTKSGNYLTESTSNLDKRIRNSETANRRIEEISPKIESLGSQIESLGKGNINETSGIWIGSDENLTKYNALVNEYSPLALESNKLLPVTEDTIKVGLGGATKEVNVMDLPKSIAGRISYGLGYATIGATNEVGLNAVGDYIGTVYGTEGNSIKVGSDIKENNLVFNFDRSSRGTQQYKNGQPVYSTTETIILPKYNVVPERNKFDILAGGIRTSGNVAGVVGEVSPYFIPVAGTALLIGGVGENLANANYNPVEYIKRNPEEAIVLASLGALKVIKKANKLFKFTKKEKYLNPENIVEKSAVRENKIVTNEFEPKARIRPKVSNFKDEERNILKIKTKGKGSTKQTEQYLTEDFTGNVQEVRKTGINKKKTFSGVESLTNGEYKEVLNINDKLQRVTKIDKTGKGTIELVNPNTNKVIKSVKIKPGSEIDTIGKVNIKSNSKIIDEQVNNPISIQENTLNGKLINRKVLSSQNEPVYSFERPNLKASRKSGKLDLTLKESSNPQTGKFKIEQDISGYSDTIQASEEKGLIQFKKAGKNLVIKKEIGTTIEYGEDVSKDLSQAITNKKAKLVARQVTPTVNRELLETKSRVTVLGYVNPKYSKDLKILNAEKSKSNKFIKGIIEKEAKTQAKVLNINKPSKVSSKIEDIEFNTPTYVGGKGSQSQYAYGGEKFESTALRSQVYVPDAESLLKNTPMPKSSDISINPSIQNSILPSFRGRSIAKINNNIQMPSTKTDNILAQEINVKPSSSVINLNDIKLDVQSDTKLDNKNIQDTKNINGSSSREITQTKQKEDTLTILKSELKVNQKTRQEMKLRQQTKTRQEQFRELKTRTPNFKVPGLGNAVSKVKKMIVERPEEFDIFVKKQGQDILLGKASSKEGAKDLLLGKISNTLRASGYVQRKSGEKIKVSELGSLGMNFGRSKKDNFRVVEVKNKRLKTKGSSQEVSEIMSFKKSKGSKNLFKL